MGAAVSLFARHALLPGGWRRDVLLAWDADGDLTSVIDNAAPPDGVELAEYVLPGMVNLHSHSFQRALGGRTEFAADGRGSHDSFWTWRDLMYRFARNITPDQLEAIAAQLFSECLRHGYTSVCEFHYVQRQPNGAWYDRPAETAERVIAAGRLAGIGVTMLPVLYSYAGFNDSPLKPEQQRFRTDADDVLRVIEALAPLRDGQTEVGVAPHSLRAASMAQIAQVVAALPAGRPIHLHIAEQQAEVDQCLAATGMRSVRYLYDQLTVDARWCLVHATHLDASEISHIAASGAVAGLCPTTEANLGDGLFPLEAFLAAGGRFGIGSDSHVSQSPVEELRWLEYGQRLQQSAAISRCPVSSARWANFYGRAPCRAGRRRRGGRWARWRRAAGPTCWCSTTRIPSCGAWRCTRCWAAWSSAATTTWCATSWSAAGGWYATHNMWRSRRLLRASSKRWQN